MERSEYTATLEKARRKAREKDETRYIIVLDDGDSRVASTCAEDYLDSAEFQAFDGVVVAAVFPDGEVDWEPV
jgi:hypothetical protein